MKSLFTLITCLFFIECANNIAINSTKKPVDVQYGKKSKPKSSCVIYFMDGFNDVVLIQKNNKKVFEGYLKTDEIISLAGYKMVDDLKSGDQLKISFQDEDLSIIFNPNFPQIEIYSFPEKLKVNFSRIESKLLE